MKGEDVSTVSLNIFLFFLLLVFLAFAIPWTVRYFKIQKKLNAAEVKVNEGIALIEECENLKTEIRELEESDEESNDKTIDLMAKYEKLAWNIGVISFAMRLSKNLKR